MPRRFPALALLCAALLTLSVGCMPSELNDLYGGRAIPHWGASVNGIDVLADMFSAAGHTVDHRRIISSFDMATVDTIVWFPDDQGAPDKKVCEWFDQWLAESSGRTLVYVGRDFDAAPLYWKTMLPLAPDAQKNEYERREARAKIEADHLPTLDEKTRHCSWFDIVSGERREAGALQGPWSRGIDPAKTAISLRSTPELPGSPQVLLRAGQDALVGRLQEEHWDQSQLLVVANGSFLLNLPLVNHEHRKLAGKLVASVGPEGRVVFLQSRVAGPPIDPPGVDASLWTVFGAWPLNAILLHLAVLGIIFCFARWPIFGRPKQPADEPVADFGKHVAALGELLRRTRDRQFAQARLAKAEEATTPTAKT